jgi:carbon-monoxide dehydrogenase medium subunit
LIQKYCPILTEAASKIATPPIRNAGTIGGNIAHAEPSADFPPSLIALKATLKLISTKGERRIPIAEFFTDYFENVLNRGEILAEIEIPSLPQRTAGTYLKLDKTTNAIAILGVATIISLDDKGVCIDAGIGLGGVGPTPLKVGRVKEILSGEKIEEDHIDRVAREAQAVARPTTDIYASAEYRKEMVYILTRRSMKESLRKALQCERGEKRP